MIIEELSEYWGIHMDGFRFVFDFVVEKNGVENIFWISSLQNYSEYSLIEKVKEIDCETSVMVYAKKNKMEAPYRFYNNYSIDKYSLDSKYEPSDQVGIFSVKKNRKK